MLQRLLLPLHQHHEREEEELLPVALLKIVILAASAKFDVIAEDPTVCIRNPPQFGSPNSRFRFSMP